MQDTKFELPPDAPKIGDKFRHYKGNHYEVVSIALHSNTHEWMVVYKPLYENPAAPLFTRPLHEWSERIEWDGTFVRRFTQCDVTHE